MVHDGGIRLQESGESQGRVVLADATHERATGLLARAALRAGDAAAALRQAGAAIERARGVGDAAALAAGLVARLRVEAVVGLELAVVGEATQFVQVAALAGEFHELVDGVSVTVRRDCPTLSGLSNSDPHHRGGSV